MEKNSCKKVSVMFKPKDIELDESSEIKKVDIVVPEIMNRSVYYRIARKKCIEEDIIDQYGMKYWEPYDIKVLNIDKSDLKRNSCIDIL